MRATTIDRLTSLVTTLALVSGCTMDDGELDAAEAGAESVDDGGEEDDEDADFRTYEGTISNPWLGTSIRTGTTVGKTNEFTPTCSVSVAPDVSFTWTAPTTSTYTFSTAGSSFDTVLHVRSFTNSAQTLACNNNVNGTLQSSVTLPITGGTTVIVVIDGVKGKSGNFQLSISEPMPCPAGCNSPPTQCHESGVCLIDPFTGTGGCHYPAKWTGADCNDGNWCSTGSHCANYSCVPDSFQSCQSPPNDCYNVAGSCDWGAQACIYTPKAAGSPCDDGVACTGGDACNGAGSCVAAVDNCPVPDPDPNPCDPWGNYEYCGIDTCCVWGSNCSICI